MRGNFAGSIDGPSASACEQASATSNAEIMPPPGPAPILWLLRTRDSPRDHGSLRSSHQTVQQLVQQWARTLDSVREGIFSSVGASSSSWPAPGSSYAGPSTSLVPAIHVLALHQRRRGCPGQAWA